MKIKGVEKEAAVERQPLKKKKGLLADSIKKRTNISAAPVTNTNIIEIKETTDEAMGTTDVKSQSEPSDIEEESGVCQQSRIVSASTKKRSVAHLKSLSNNFIQKKNLQLAPIIEDKIQVEISHDEEEEDSDEVEEESSQDIVMENVVVIEKSNMVSSSDLTIHPQSSPSD